MATNRNPWGGKITKAAALSVARKIQARDGLTWARSLRRALEWARTKAAPPAAGAEFAALRARGIFSPRDPSPEAAAHFKAAARRAPGSHQWGGR